jgi:3'-phosphoadenosine 5'-phosphosulfate sulfotransferase (PAPS reductase)/FAD synthetase
MTADSVREGVVRSRSGGAVAQRLTHLKRLEAESIHIMREVAAEFSNPVTPFSLVRFRTLGCYPLTSTIESSATTLEDIVGEMLTATTSERQGRLIDHDENASMERKKREGYF